jgi:hypothetical protein
VPETIEVKTPQGTVRRNSYLLGISEDRGTTWKFVDGSGDETLIAKLFPDIPGTLVLPKSGPAILVADQKPSTMPAVNLPDEIQNQQASIQKWLESLDGKTEKELTDLLGKEAARSEWKSGERGGLKLSYKIGTITTLSTLFLNGTVMVAHLDIYSR